ncbi:MAG: arylesterase [Betaproteobacteria bacterium]
MNFIHCNRALIAAIAAWFRRTHNRLAPLILVLAFQASLAWPAPASALAADSPILLVVGDSISAGYGLASGQGWVDLLQGKLANHGYPYKVVNASISGDTTAGGRSRIGAALTTHRPRVVIIELGGNDGLRGSALDSVRANLDFMVETAQKAGAQVLIAGMQLPPNYGSTYVRKFAAMFADIARERKAALVPFLLDGFGDRPELFQADRIHPTSQAQPLMVENIWPELTKLLHP